MDEDALLRRLLMERALRRKRELQQESVKGFGEWLPEVSPNMHWDWPHLRYIQSYMDKVTAGEIDRLMIFMPPRHGKSEQVTVRYPAYALERDPTKRILIASYGSKLAESFSRKTRSIVRARNIVELDPERKAAPQWKTRAGGGLDAAGVGGPITGLGFDIIIIDDPVKSSEEANSKASREHNWDWYNSDLFTRREPGCAIILQMTRWHEDDLAGRILEQDGDNWTVLSLPAFCVGDDPPDYPVERAYREALCPQRYDEKALEELERVLGRNFTALYQQRPSPAEGEVFMADWFNNAVAAFPSGVKRTQVWDTAMETKEVNDFSAMVEGYKDENGNIYVAAMENKRMEFPELVRSMRSHRDRVGLETDVCVEDKANGKPARQTLRTEGVPVIEIPAGTKDKKVRARSITNICEAGQVVLVDAPGNCNAEMIRQLMIFDNGTHDDLVDAFVHLLRRLTGGARRWTKEDIAKVFGSNAHISQLPSQIQPSWR
jgi:predicted phage terminase large subunit-like protein